MDTPETTLATPEQSTSAETPVVEPKTEIPEAPPDEKTLLLARARLMGMKVSNNIGLATLKERIAEHMKTEVEKTEKAVTQLPTPAPSFPTAAPAQFAPSRNVPAQMTVNALPNGPETRQQIRERLIRDQMKLVRLRITNLDPKKKNIPGEVFTMANKYLGTVRKYIPFGNSEDGYHVPWCIYEMLKERKFLHIRSIRNKNGRGEHIETSYVPEFSLEVLPQLTEKEIKELARMQAAKKGNSED